MIHSVDAKLLCVNNLRRNRWHNRDPMKPRPTPSSIVSALALPYTERERISCHFNREGAHLCKQKLCVNQAQED